MLAEPWRLDGSVALRPEPFGALAYHFGTRKLSFLKTPELVDVVRRLEQQPVGRGGPHRRRRARAALAGVRRARWRASRPAA